MLRARVAAQEVGNACRSECCVAARRLLVFQRQAVSYGCKFIAGSKFVRPEPRFEYAPDRWNEG